MVNKQFEIIMPVENKIILGIIICFSSLTKTIVCWSVASTYSTPFLGQNNQYYYMKENELLTLKCRFNPLKTSSLQYVRWNKFTNNGNNVNSEQIYFSKTGLTGSLSGQAVSQMTDYVHQLNINTFKSTRDIGLYQCIVCDYSFTCQSSTVNVSAEYITVSPTIEILVANIELYEPESLTLICMAKNGYPNVDVSYTWHFTGRYSGNQTLPSIGNRFSVASVTDEQYGTYTCTVNAVGGAVSNSTSITVYYSPKILNQANEILMVSIGSKVQLNATFRSSSLYNITAEWQVINDYNERFKIPQSLGSLTKDPHQLDTYISTVVFQSIRPAEIGLIQCQINNGILTSQTKDFQLKFDIPIINQESLVYKKQDFVATLYWSLPTGVYTEIQIEQCIALSSGLKNCQKHRLENQKMTQTQLTESAGEEYFYYMIIYQHNIQVLRSEAFTLITEEDDSIFAIVAGATAAVVVIIVLIIPLVLIQLMDCECLDKNQKKDDDTALKRFVRRLKLKKTKSKSAKDMKLEDIEKDNSSKHTPQSSNTKGEPEKKDGSVEDRNYKNTYRNRLPIQPRMDIDRNVNIIFAKSNKLKQSENEQSISDDNKQEGLSKDNSMTNEVSNKQTTDINSSDTISDEQHICHEQTATKDINEEKDLNIPVVSNTDNDVTEIFHVKQGAAISDKENNQVENEKSHQNDIYKESDSSEYSYSESVGDVITDSYKLDIQAGQSNKDVFWMTGSASNISSYKNSSEVIHKCGKCDKLEDDTDSDRIHVYEL